MVVGRPAVQKCKRCDAESGVKASKVFGLPPGVMDVAGLVRNFDYDSLKSRGAPHLRYDLAPSFGKLDKGSVKQMDENLKIIIAGTTRVIEKLTDRSWGNVMAVMTNNPLLVPVEDSLVHRSDKYIGQGGLSVFKFDGSPDPAIAREVETWFVGKLIQGLWLQEQIHPALFNIIFTQQVC